jgi:DMSO/TMAO reductase YedYZ molybdopterin-dependent catalytic subunit
MDRILGDGPARRRFLDLARIGLDGALPPGEAPFIRTGAPAVAARSDPWRIRLGGNLPRTGTLDLAGIASLARPIDTFAWECAGNDPGGRFGLLGSGSWTGILWEELAERVARACGAPAQDDAVLVRGIDAEGGGEGAAWIFAPGQLEAAGAFLATGLDGGALPADNGFPARLFVPGWYGCACVKWVTSLDWVAPSSPATAHMLRYAERTHQAGVPLRADGFAPATTVLSALPVRVERWRLDGKPAYRIVGISWGGDTLNEDLQIHTGSGGWEDVVFAARRRRLGQWSVWTYGWRPQGPGDFPIRLRAKDRSVRSPRLDGDAYLRACRIDEA